MIGRKSKGLKGTIPAVALLLLGLFGLGFDAQAKMIEHRGKVYDIAGPGEFKPGEVVIRVKPGVAATSVQALATEIGGKVKAEIPEYGLYLLQIPQASSRVSSEDAGKAETMGAVQSIKTDHRVISAFPNYKVSIPEPPEVRSPAGRQGNGAAGDVQEAGMPLAGVQSCKKNRIPAKNMPE